MESGELIIFDCDGVLVDSEPISVDVLVDAIRKAGGTISNEEAFDLFLGRSLSSVVETLKTQFEIVAGPAFLDRMRVALYERFREELEPVDGIKAALAALGTRHCVASSSQPERIRLSLTVTGLIDFFEPNIFSASMVRNGKPAPDLFFYAAERMQADPKDCIVIEDSPAGIQAAKAAGMRVFAFIGATHGQRQSYRQQIEELAPDVTFDRMDDLIHLLSKK
ncbi:HAD family hydrolase [Rhizobium sp. PAMB 3174]